MTRWLLPGLCLILACALPAASQVDLRYGWKPDEVFILDKTLETSGTVQTGTHPALETRQRTLIRKKVTVNKVDALGNAQLSVAVLSVSATKTVGESRFQYSLTPDQIALDHTRIWQDSQDPKRIQERLRQLFKPRVMWCAARGQTQSPVQPEAVRQGTAAADEFSLFGLGEEGWIILPDQPVQIGDSWQDASRQPVRSGTAELSNRLSLRLSGLETRSGNTVATIAFEREWQSRNLQFNSAPRDTSNNPEKVTAIFPRTEQHFTGTVEFDASEGRTLRCECEGTADVRYRLTQPTVLFKETSPLIHYRWDRVRSQTEWKQAD